jgi:hypothetical protein
MEADMQFNKVRFANGLHCFTPARPQRVYPDTLADWLKVLGKLAALELALAALQWLLP